MNNILCLTDFSEAANNALRYAAWFAAETKSKLTILNVVHDKAFFAGIGRLNEDELTQKLDQANQNLMACREFISGKTTSTQVQCDYRAAHGDLGDVVNKISREENFDLVIMGTTGAGHDTLEELMLGSNAIAMFEHLQVPVLAVPFSFTKRQLKHLVFATDFQPLDEQVVNQAMAMCSGFEAHLHLLHVTEEKSKAAEQKLIDFTKPFANRYDHLHATCITHKDTERGVLTYSKEVYADIIVLAGKEYGFFGRIFNQSTTEMVSYQTKVPLLVFPVAWKKSREKSLA